MSDDQDESLDIQPPEPDSRSLTEEDTASLDPAAVQSETLASIGPESEPAPKPGDSKPGEPDPTPESKAQPEPTNQEPSPEAKKDNSLDSNLLLAILQLIFGLGNEPDVAEEKKPEAKKPEQQQQQTKKAGQKEEKAEEKHEATEESSAEAETELTETAEADADSEGELDEGIEAAPEPEPSEALTYPEPEPEPDEGIEADAGSEEELTDELVVEAGAASEVTRLADTQREGVAIASTQGTENEVRGERVVEGQAQASASMDSRTIQYDERIGSEVGGSEALAGTAPGAVPEADLDPSLGESIETETDPVAMQRASVSITSNPYQGDGELSINPISSGLSDAGEALSGATEGIGSGLVEAASEVIESAGNTLSM